MKKRRLHASSQQYLFFNQNPVRSIKNRQEKTCFFISFTMKTEKKLKLEIYIDGQPLETKTRAEKRQICDFLLKAALESVSSGRNSAAKQEKTTKEY